MASPSPCSRGPKPALLPLCLGLLALAPAAAADLTLEVEINPDPARPGDALRVEITAGNDGLVALTNVVVEVLLPDQIDNFSEDFLLGSGTCNAGSSGAVCERGETIVFDLGTLPAGEGRTVSLVPLVRSDASAPADGSLIDFEVTGNVAGSPVLSLTESVEARTAPAFSLVLAADREPVDGGDTLEYTLHFLHVAAARLAPSTTLELTLPAGVTFVSATGGGSESAGTVSWSLGTLQPGEGGVRRALVTVAGGAVDGALLRAEAEVVDAAAPTPERARASAVTRVEDVLGLRLALEVNPDPARPGETVVTAATVVNPGFVQVPSVLLEIPLPDGVANFTEDFILGAGTCNQGSSGAVCERRESVVFALGTLGAQEGRTVVIPPIVSSAGAALLPFHAFLRSGDAPGATVRARHAVEVQPEPFLDLALTENRDPVGTFDNFRYTVDFGHVATARAAPGAVLQLDLPPGVDFVAASDGGTESGNVVTWPLGTLLPGQAGRRHVDVAVAVGVQEGALLQARAGIVDADSPPAQVRASSVARVENGVGLDVAFELAPDPARPGETLRATFTVANQGFVQAPNVLLEVPLPDGLANFAENLLVGGGTCNQASSGAVCERREYVVFALGNLPSGESRTLSLPPLVATGADTPANGTLLTFDAYLRSGTETGATVLARRSAEVQAAPAFELSVAEHPEPVESGTTLSYVLSFGHVADARVAPGTVLELELPPGVNFLSASDGGSESFGVVSWNLGLLSPGEGGERRASVNVAALARPLLLAHATIRDTDDPPQHARADVVTPGGSATPPLALALELAPDPARPGQTLRATATVSNPGLVPVPGVVLELPLPDGLDSIDTDFVIGPVTCNTGSSGVLCERRERAVFDLGTLAAGEGRSVVLPPLVTAGANAPADASLVTFDGFLRSGAQVGSPVTARATTAVRAAPALELSLADPADPVAPTGSLQYVLSFGHVADARLAPGAQLELHLPPEVVFTSASDGGSESDGVVTWSLGSLDPGESGERHCTVSVPDTTPAGTLLKASARIDDTDAPPERARAEAVTRVEVALPISVAFLVYPVPQDPGGPLTVQVTALNQGAVPIPGVVLEIPLPDDLDTVSEASTTPPATCNGGSSGITCQRREPIVFDIGTLDPGVPFVATVPTVISDGAAAPPLGTLIPFTAYLGDTVGQAIARSDARVGLFEECDDDGVPDEIDNCVCTDNPLQVNTNAGVDDFGNICDPDLDDDGDIDALDRLRLLACFRGGNIPGFDCANADLVGANPNLEPDPLSPSVDAFDRLRLLQFFRTPGSQPGDDL